LFPGFREYAQENFSTEALKLKEQSEVKGFILEEIKEDSYYPLT
jgi:hypothetical protein